MAMSGKRVKGLETSKDVCDDSSESETETEPAKSFHRRLSTNKDIKCSAAIKEGYLLKQTSFQRWRRRYFKIKGCKLYYAKDTKNTVPETVRQIIARLIKKNKKCKYPPELRNFALTVHFYSPKAYRYIRKNFENVLPHEATIRKWYLKIDGSPGITHQAIEAIRQQVSIFKQKGKSLILNITFDEMALRRQIYLAKDNKVYGYIDIGSEFQDDAAENLEEATNVLVFMAVSLNSNWKIPIAYFIINNLIGSEKANILKNILEIIFETGAKIYSITFDAHASNINMCKSLGANFDATNLRPVFKHPVTDEDIYI